MKYPILMADIVDSRKTNSSALINDFRKIVKYINTEWSDSILSPLTITLGDEFQSLMKDIESCYKVIFDIEEYIILNSLNLKIRYIVNYGEIDTPINKNIAYEMLGKGLTYAREQLNLLKSSQTRFKVSINKSLDTVDVMNNLFVIYGSYVDSWKMKDFGMVSEFIRHNDYKIVADELNMNRSSTWRRYKTLKIEEYNLIKDTILTLHNLL